MRTTSLIVMTLLATALAGCVTDDPPEPAILDDGDQDPVADIPLTMTVSACTEYTAILPMPAGDFGEVPPGWSTIPFDPAGQTEQLFVPAYHCEDGTHGNTSTGALDEAFVVLLVEPPAEYRIEGVDIYGILLYAFSTNEQNTEAYVGWGVDTDEAPVSVERLLSTPVAHAGRSTVGGVPIYTEFAGPADTQPGGAAFVFLPETGPNDEWPVSALSVSWTASPFQQGTSELVIGPTDTIPPVVIPGIGLSWWGDEYVITSVYTPLAATEPVQGNTTGTGFLAPPSYPIWG